MEDLSCESNNGSESRVLSKYEIRKMASKMATIKKKTNELSILCDTPVFFIAHYPDGKTETWPQEESKLMDLITRYKNTKRNKKFKYARRPVINNIKTTTRDERFKKLLSLPNKDIVMKVVQERIELLKRRKSEIQKKTKIGTQTPINDCEIDTEIGKDETQTSVIIVESDDEETVRRAKSPPLPDQFNPWPVQTTARPDQIIPRPHQFSQNYIPITGTLYVPNNNFQIGDLQRNISEGNYYKFPPIFMPKQQQQLQQYTAPLYDHHYSLGSNLERDFISGFDTATSSTNI